MTNLNMDFSLSEAQQALVDALTKILADHTSMDRLREADGSERWYDLDLWAQLAKADLLGAGIPESAGGLGYGILELCLMLQEVGRCVAPIPAVAALVASTLPVARYGTPEQVAELGGVARGEVIGTAALVEAGADPLAPVTRAERDGEGWRITGRKTLVPAANVATGILVPAAVDGEVGLFVVPADAAGLTVERQRVTGLEPHFSVRLDRVRVDDAARIGEIARGREILAFTVEHTTAAMCAVAAGVADRAVRLTAEYTSNRRQFDRPIATFQAVESRLADSFINAEAMRLSMLLAAHRLSEDLDAAAEVATAKYWAADGGNFVAHTALHCHGGISIDLDYPVHRYFLWAKQLEFTLGGAPQQLRRLGQLIAAS